MSISSINQSDLDVIIASLADALYTEKFVEDIAQHFAISLTEIRKPCSPLVSKLSSEMRESARLRKLLREDSPNAMEEIGRTLSLIMDKFFPDIKYSIIGREKSIMSDVNKRISKILEEKSPQIQDIFALRLIVLNEEKEINNISTCYNVLNKCLKVFSFMENDFKTELAWDLSIKEVLTQLTNHRNSVMKNYPMIVLPSHSGVFAELKNYVKDYIFYANSSGYQSLHFIVFYRGFPIEIQIRTLQMHYWAEHGSAQHTAYKNNKTFKGIKLECFDTDQIKSPRYLIDNSGGLKLYPGLVSAMEFFSHSNI